MLLRQGSFDERGRTMRFLYLGKTPEGRHLILDTNDLVTEAISDSDLQKVKKSGVKVQRFSAENSGFSLGHIDHQYVIYLGELRTPVYRGEFPTECSRNNIFGYDISLVDIFMHDGYIYLGIVCNCCVKYDYEVGMVMFQLISLNSRDIGHSGCLSCYTREPVLFSDDWTYERCYNECGGDYPDKYVDDVRCHCVVTPESINIWGAVYKDRPLYDDICTKLEYNRLKCY